MPIRIYRKAIALIVLASILNGCSGYSKSRDQVTYHSFDEANGRASFPIKDADPQTFKTLDSLYAKDRQHAYWRGRQIEGADPGTFVVVGQDYAKDAQHVYFNFLSVVPDADAASFSTFGPGWGRDKQDVYLNGRSIRACDPATFKVLSGQFWQADSKCAYHESEQVPDADAKSFVVLSPFFAKDRARVYHSSAARSLNMEACDPASFRLLSGDGISWQIDNRCVYYAGTVLPGADPTSFKILKGMMGRDKSQCYLGKNPTQCPS
jgi:DKNYY family